MAYQIGLNGEPQVIRTDTQRKEFRKVLADPSFLKVGFNNGNFDDIVLERYGYSVNETNRHDVMIMFKCIAPLLPAYSQKFLSFYYFRDPHFPEMEVLRYISENQCTYYDVPKKLLDPYVKHDIVQLVNLFRIAWDIVTRPAHWDAYQLDMEAFAPTHEMMLVGGMYLDPGRIRTRLRWIHKWKCKFANIANRLSHGRVLNVNSSKQLGKYFNEEDFEMKLTDSGEFQVNKKLLVDLRSRDPIARCAYNYRMLDGLNKFFVAYMNALNHDPSFQNWIPRQLGVSAAKTRRYTSKSFYRINFQNPPQKVKEVQLVPPGFLGVFIDATQVENIVHIYESEDDERRAAYEADPDWNEYVWLCNRILGVNETKSHLDSIRSERVPNWSVYKLYKTVKLALNFGMGISHFSETTGIPHDKAVGIFGDIHDACPAIHLLQRRVTTDLRTRGYVEDTFGHRYSGPERLAYKVVAYLIQGCGTGSLPKAQIRSNWNSLRDFDKFMPTGERSGHMAGTTHDEIEMRINLKLGPRRTLQLLQKLMYNMTDKFSPKFDDIPLRAKLYLTRTTAAEHTEVDINDHETILEIMK